MINEQFVKDYAPWFVFIGVVGLLAVFFADRIAKFLAWEKGQIIVENAEEREQSAIEPPQHVFAKMHAGDGSKINNINFDGVSLPAGTRLIDGSASQGGTISNVNVRNTEVRDNDDN